MLTTDASNPHLTTVNPSVVSSSRLIIARPRAKLMHSLIVPTIIVFSEQSAVTKFTDVGHSVSCDKHASHRVYRRRRPLYLYNVIAFISHFY